MCENFININGEMLIIIRHDDKRTTLSVLEQ